MTFELTTIDELQQTIDDFLSRSIEPDTDQSLLHSAMQYSVNAGGKRLRPALTLRVIQALQRDNFELGKYLKAASALELLHTYSLIHDDLPALDNDDLRRGMPTNHKKFGDAIAILAGDGLLTLAFQWLVDNPLNDQVTRNLTLQLSHYAGPAGMVAGQVIDISNEGSQLTYPELQNLHLKKTGALIEYATQAGGIMAGATAEQQALLLSFGRHYGLAFQIYDDLMDQTSTTEQMGKAVHKDAVEEKNTYPGLFGIDGTKDKLSAVIKDAKADLEKLSAISPIKKTDFDDFLVYFKI